MFARLRHAIALLILAALLLSVHHTRLLAQEAAATDSATGVPFNMEALSVIPDVFPSEDVQVEGVKSFYYSGPMFKGKQTRVFACYGVPEVKDRADTETQKFPAIVLIHGGGGTAFDRWVKLWNSRGYAAIAMDLCGCIPKGTYGKWQRHDFGGPPGWDASFTQLDDPVEDQWTHQAVSAVVLAHSLIRSFPEVDSDRTGVTGISWGGYLTCIVAGVDNRFQFAAPVYGCGFLGNNSAWLPSFEKMGAVNSDLWLKQWDPSMYLGKVRMPMLWVNGTNDFAYPMDSWKKSWQLPASPQTLCLRIRMPHGHGAAGENPEEILIFANSILNEGKPLAKFTKLDVSNDVATATFESDIPILNAELCFTRSTTCWPDREWEILPAQIDVAQSRVSANVPADASVFYLNLFDDRQCVVSTEHTERPAGSPEK